MTKDILKFMEERIDLINFKADLLLDEINISKGLLTSLRDRMINLRLKKEYLYKDKVSLIVHKVEMILKANTYKDKCAKGYEKEILELAALGEKLK